MATQNERKKQKKHRREAKKAARRNEYNQQARAIAKRLSKYPEIIFDEAEGTPEFVAAVRKAQSEIDLDDPAICHPTWQRAYRIIHEHGYPALEQTMADIKQQAAAESSQSASLVEVNWHSFILHYGTQIFDRIPLETRRRLLPYNDLHVRPAGKCLLLSFSSLLQRRGKGGTIFYSRRRPTVTLEGTRGL